MVHKLGYCKYSIPLVSSETISFIYDQNTSPPNERISHSNMQVLTDIKNPTIDVLKSSTGDSLVDTDVLMEVTYSCNFLAVSDSSTCPDIGTSRCHAGIIEHFEIRGFKMTP